MSIHQVLSVNDFKFPPFTKISTKCIHHCGNQVKQCQILLKNLYNKYNMFKRNSDRFVIKQWFLTTILKAHLCSRNLRACMLRHAIFFKLTMRLSTLHHWNFHYRISLFVGQLQLSSSVRKVHNLFWTLVRIEKFSTGATQLLITPLVFAPEYLRYNQNIYEKKNR